MNKKNSTHLANWLAILGGIFWIAFHLYFIFSGVSHLEIGSAVLLAGLGVFFMALAVYSVLQSPASSRVGKIGAGILISGLTLVFFGATLSGLDLWAGAWLLVIAGEALTTLGLVAFSLGLLSERPREFWKWLPLFLAPLYFMSFSTTSSSFPDWAPVYLPEWLAVVYGGGWVLLGVLLPHSLEKPAGDA